MLCNDTVTDAQAKAGALADFLCGEERVKEVFDVISGNTGAVIGEGSPYHIVNSFRGDSKAAPVIFLYHEMFGVDNEVDEYLLQLERICHNFGQISGEPGSDLDFVHSQFVGA